MTYFCLTNNKLGMKMNFLLATIVFFSLQCVTKETVATDRVKLVTFAKSFIGLPYMYGAQDPKKGFDCSGFVNYVYKNFEITVPRSSAGFKNFGNKITLDEIKIGDILVFYGYKDTATIGHVGIVCEANGKNSKFVHASSGKAMQVVISDLNSTHYSNRFFKAVRVMND